MTTIEISQQKKSPITIMIFVEGTILEPKSIFSIYNHKSYQPIGKAVQIINGWWKQGANILYCTSRRGKGAREMAELLQRFGFQGSALHAREKGEKYKNIVEDVRPNILIEDDCKSIGGAWQMCITHISEEIKDQIKSVVVREFKGIDHLPQDLNELTL